MSQRRTGVLSGFAAALLLFVLAGPAAAQSAGLDRIVVIFLENRSFS